MLKAATTLVPLLERLGASPLLALGRARELRSNQNGRRSFWAALQLLAVLCQQIQHLEKLLQNCVRQLIKSWKGVSNAPRAISTVWKTDVKRRQLLALLE